MIRTTCHISTQQTNGAAAPRRLMIQVQADTGPANYRLRGMLEIEGLDAWRMDAIESALVRDLGGMGTLILGPVYLENLLDGRNVEEAACQIARDYDLSPAELASRAGISVDTAESLLTETRRRHPRVIRPLAALALRLSDAPTPGEALRRQRCGLNGMPPRKRSTVAGQIGISEEKLCRWEDDLESVPLDLAPRVAEVLGLRMGEIRSDDSSTGPVTGAMRAQDAIISGDEGEDPCDE